jgi:hypothetical protein
MTAAIGVSPHFSLGMPKTAASREEVTGRRPSVWVEPYELEVVEGDNLAQLSRKGIHQVVGIVAVVRQNSSRP